MRYLDYLPHTPYAQLPPEVQSEISYEDYEARRELVTQLQSKALPTELKSRYRQRLIPPVAVVQPINHGYWRYAAVAGWLLFLVTGLLWWSASTPLPGKTIPPPMASAPRVIEIPTLVRDTVIQFIHQPRVLTVRDTVYVPTPVYADSQGFAVSDSAITSGSRSLAEGMDWQPLLAAPQPLE